MKNVDISTPNHVTIAYDLAGLSQRIVSTIIDFIVVVMYMYIIGISSVSNVSTVSELETSQFILILLSIPAMTYSLICEAFFNGQSLGKLALGIKVIRMDGKKPGLGEATIRWVFRLVDIWFSAGAIATMLVSSTERGQRVGDLLANTTVIRTKPNTVYTIDDLMSIKDSSKHTPTYQGVVQFSDEDMLLLKNVVDRARKNPNKHHEKLLEELCIKIENKLNIVRPVKDTNEKFLKSILQDYIVLTRS